MNKIDFLRAVNATDNIEEKKKLKKIYEEECKERKDYFIRFIYDQVDEDSYDSYVLDSYNHSGSPLSIEDYIVNEGMDNLIEGYMGTIDPERFTEWMESIGLDEFLEDFSGDKTIEFEGVKVGYGVDMKSVVRILVY